MAIIERKTSYEEALAVCIQHYVDRGYSVKDATDYVSRGEQEVFRVYDIIQKENEFIRKNGKVQGNALGLNEGGRL